MPKILRAVMAVAVLSAALAGCNRETGGGEAQYLHLFNSAWAKSNTRGLYEVRVASVAPLPDGMKIVTVNYLFDNGMVPDQGQAAMLVSPENRLADPCVVDLEIDQCLGGGAPVWHARP